MSKTQTRPDRLTRDPADLEAVRKLVEGLPPHEHLPRPANPVAPRRVEKAAVLALCNGRENLADDALIAYFRDRPDMLARLLDAWERDNTDVLGKSAPERLAVFFTQRLDRRTCAWEFDRQTHRELDVRDLLAAVKDREALAHKIMERIPFDRGDFILADIAYRNDKRVEEAAAAGERNKAENAKRDEELRAHVKPVVDTLALLGFDVSDPAAAFEAWLAFLDASFRQCASVGNGIAVLAGAGTVRAEIAQVAALDAAAPPTPDADEKKDPPHAEKGAPAQAAGAPRAPIRES